MKDGAKEIENANKEAAKITEEVYKETFDKIGDVIKDREKDIEGFTSEIEKAVNKIADIDQKISDL
jgi:vacuolar-type H+-ATPase subunit H